MDAALPGLWSLSPLAALVGLLAFLILSVARGTLIPRSSHEREISIYVATLANKDKIIETQQGQVTALLEVGKTMEAVLKSAGPRVDRPTGGS